MRRRDFSIHFLVAPFAFSPEGYAQSVDGDELFFAGLSFLPRFDQTQLILPITSRVLTEEVAVRLNRELAAAVVSATPAGFPRIVASELGELRGRDRALCLTLAVDRESVTLERHADLSRLSVEVWAQALAFDFVNRQVVASFPFACRFNDVSSRQFSEVELDQAILRIVTGNHAGGLLNGFLGALRSVSMPQPASRTLRVTEVVFSDLAREQLEGLGQSLETASALIAADFGALLVTNQSIPVLPFGSGAAIGATMAARFADNSVFQLSIPEPDYHIKIKIEGFRRIEAERTDLRIALVYGVFITIQIVEPLSGRVFFDGELRKGAQRTVVVGSQLNEWPSYYEALLGLMSEFTQRIGRRDQEWERRHLVSSGARSMSIEALGGVIQQCR